MENCDSKEEPPEMPVPSKIKHILHCLLLFSIISYFEYVAVLKKNYADELLENPFKKYGIFLTCLFYFLKTLVFLTVPQTIFNFLGLVCFNTFPGKTVLKTSPLLSPLICIRIVTRGDYPELVKKNVNRNLNICFEAGLENYFLEVVSDKPIGLTADPRVREVVVPPEYVTRSGALYKARALQYCLEESINILGDSDWIVHLDEETLLTDNSIKGILNFVIEGKYHIGQGLITYANEDVVNWFTTLADCFRVADDMGKLRFQFKVFHKPLFSFKGSFVVAQVSTEKAVSFDNGPEGSIAEDCYFAIKAFSQGYTFDFVEGEMWEKSPFTFTDFIQQRKRWIQGILLVVHSNNMSCQYRICLGLSCYAWVTLPLQLTNIIITTYFPLPYSYFLNIIVALVGAINIYMFIFGAIKSFNLKRLGILKGILCIVGSILVIPFNVMIETIAACWGYAGKKHKFYVVKKS